LPPAQRPVPAAPLRPATPAPATTQTATFPPSEPVTNPIAKKMLDALDKYERLKKQQEQDDKAKEQAPAGVDLSL